MAKFVMMRVIFTGLIGNALRRSGTFVSGTRCRNIGEFRDGESGATAIEFAILSFPFLALLLAVIEVGLVFFATQVMETGVEGAARLIRTGQSQGFSEAQFKTEICNRISTMFDCDKLKLDVRTHAQFAGVDLDAPIVDDELDDSDFIFRQGAGGDIVVVRAFYEWPITVSFLQEGFGGLANGNRLLISTSAFRNEPFGGGGGG